MTQCEAIMAYLKAHGRITPMDAYYHLGITRLAARVSDLRRSGVPITTVTRRVKTQYEHDTTVAEYRLEEAHE